MKFGMSNEAKRAQRRDNLKGGSVFLWWPRKLEDGRWAWLERVEWRLQINSWNRQGEPINVDKREEFYIDGKVDGWRVYFDALTAPENAPMTGFRVPPAVRGLAPPPPPPPTGRNMATDIRSRD